MKAFATEGTKELFLTFRIGAWFHPVDWIRAILPCGHLDDLRQQGFDGARGICRGYHSGLDRRQPRTKKTGGKTEARLARITYAPTRPLRAPLSTFLIELHP